MKSILKDKVNILFILLLLFSMAGTLYFQVLNKAPQIWDSASHINLSILYSYKIKELKFSEIPTLSGYYPPFIHLLGGIFFLIVPIANSQLILSFLFYLAALWFIYLLTMQLSSGNTRIALLAAVVFAFLPQTYKELRLFQLDLPLTALFTASIYFLHKSKGLTSKKDSTMFFILISLAQLTKWYAFIFAVVPYIYEILRHRGNLKENTKYVVQNSVIGLIIALALNLVWYFLNFQSILNFFQLTASFGELNDPRNPLSVEGLTEYLKLISVYQTFFINFAVATLALVALIIKKKQHAVYFLSSIVFAYAVFSILVNKDIRYLMPISIYFAIAIAMGLGYLLASVNKNLVTTGAVLTWIYVVVNLFLYVFTSYNQFYEGLPNQYKYVPWLISGPVKKYNWANWNPPEMAYDARDWKMQEVYDKIVEVNEDKSETTNILFAIDYPYFNKIEFDTLQIYDRQAYKVDLTPFDLDINTELGEYDYVLTSFNPGPSSLRHHQKMFEINRYLAGEQQKFEQVSFFRLPNGEDVYIFKNTGSKYFPINGE